jgi:hypothetical protein
VTEVDNKIRDSIKDGIEGQLELGILSEDNKWVFHEFPISSKVDYFLGFTIGKLMYMAWTVFKDNNYDATDSDLEEVHEIIRQKIPEILRRIIKELNLQL